MPEVSADFVELSADVVAAYVSNNSVTRADLPALISTVHAALKHAAEGTREPEPLVPPVPINKTVFPDHIISLEDGRRYKSMKRHLSGRGLTPEQYRAKWGLRPDYPMVAPSYSKARSELAKALGLGQTVRVRRRGRSARPKRLLRWREARFSPGLFRCRWVRRSRVLTPHERCDDQRGPR